MGSLIHWRGLGCAVLATIVAAATPANADPLSGLAGPSLGLGRDSCASWLAHRRANDQQARLYAQWAWGFVSGYNQFVRSSQKQVFFWYDEAHMLDLLDIYCRRSPDASVSEAMTATFMQMHRAPRRLLPAREPPGHWDKVLPPVGRTGQPLGAAPQSHARRAPSAKH